MCVGTSRSRGDPAAATHGIAELAFATGSDGRTRLARLHHRAPLHALFPAAVEPGLGTAVLVTTTGGLVGGDRLDVRLTAEPGCAAQVTMQAAEKVYRSLGADCRIGVDLSAASGSWLEWLPQETILFEDARLNRITRIEHAPGARVLAGEMLVFGRHASGERLTRGKLRETWEVRRAGRLLWADALAADGDLRGVLASPACLGAAVAVASLIYLGDSTADALSLARDLTGTAVADMAAAATCVGGVLIVRWLARDARALRAAFGRFWAAFRHRVGGWAEALPRVWSV
jgi:urease accessory protein